MNVRDEVSKIDGTRTEKLAELSAIIRNSGEFNNGIKITIENNCVARKIFKLFKEVYDINAGITVRRRYGFNNNLIYMINVNYNCEANATAEDTSSANYTLNTDVPII